MSSRDFDSAHSHQPAATAPTSTSSTTSADGSSTSTNPTSHHFHLPRPNMHFHNLFSHSSSAHGPIHSSSRKKEYDFGPNKDAKDALKDAIGEGGYSTVIKATWKARGGMVVAIKVVRKEAIKNTGDYLKIIDGAFDRIRSNQNICSCLDWFESSTKYYLTFPLLTGGELLERLNKRGRYTEAATRKVMRVMLDTLAFIHSHGIIHRDIKPDNFLYRHPESEIDDFLLIDFGISKILDDTDEDKRDQLEVAGTPGYAAPEVFTRRGYGKNSDVFGVGCIAWNLLSSSSPWQARDYAPLIRETVEMEPAFKENGWKGVSDETKQFVRHLMSKDPSHRPTSKVALTHPWLSLTSTPRLDIPAAVLATAASAGIPAEEAEHHDPAGTPVGEREAAIPKQPTLKPECNIARRMTIVGMEALKGGAVPEVAAEA